MRHTDLFCVSVSSRFGLLTSTVAHHIGCQLQFRYYCISLPLMCLWFKNSMLLASNQLGKRNWLMQLPSVHEEEMQRKSKNTGPLTRSRANRHVLHKPLVQPLAELAQPQILLVSKGPWSQTQTCVTCQHHGQWPGVALPNSTLRYQECSGLD